MEIKELLALYLSDSHIQILLRKIGAADHAGRHVSLKGLTGSLDAIIAACFFKVNPKTSVFVLDDREQAAFFHNDLESLLQQEILFYPSSQKRAYSYQEVDNANVLSRAEILNKLSSLRPEPLQIVTYPEALSEKVISKKTLIANTFTIAIGESLDQSFLTEFLGSSNFEMTDFVYEAGQFSVRGGIIDVFSYASEYPYRIELFGDEVDSIRAFDPGTQLSVATVDHINILPDIQQRLSTESRVSFFDFIPNDTAIWLKDAELTLGMVENAFEKTAQALAETTRGGVQVVADPVTLFETKASLAKSLRKFKTIEFGRKFYFKDGEGNALSYSSQPQPSFNKDFKRLIDDLSEHQYGGFTNIIVAEQGRQLDRLERIFEDIDPRLTFRPLRASFREGFIDPQMKVVCYTDHQIFSRFHRFHLKEKFSKSKALTLRELKTLQPGDFVTHVDYGIGRFAGMEKKQVGAKVQETIRLIYRDNDVLYVSVHNLHKIAKYTGKDGNTPVMSKLGSQEWENKKSRAKKEIKDIAHELIVLYSKRRQVKGYSFSPDTFLQAELESSFMFEDTPDQSKATGDVKEDMQKPYPMDRLICGDVGFGKTEVAIRAAFKAITDGKQVAVLVPTTILAMQHFKTFSERLADFPASIEYINRFKSTKDIQESLRKATSGETDILIGTHRILNKDVVFKDLGLLIVDEEQKFGVKAKERLKEMRVSVDVLTLTATPIPRTLHFSLMGARDLSIIATPPPNRQPVTTEIRAFDETLIRDVIRYEVERGGQVFFVHNRIKDIESIANIVLRLVPEARIGVAHGQMDGDKLERIMLRFIEGDYDILVSTNIIESGIDIPNANTIIINSAHMFGLSDLHQMRGRVGRSNRKAFCYLLTPPISTLTRDSRKRLQTLEEFSELGDGFKVAMRDLDIRGAGNLLGSEQSGFVTDLGYEMYHKILDEAVQELKEQDFADLMSDSLSVAKDILPDCQIETDLAVLIPENYIKNISERLALYTQLDQIRSEDELDAFERDIKDRFGPIPNEVSSLLKTVKIRWLAEQLHMEKLTLKSNTLKGYFVSSENALFYQSDKFGRILDFVQKNENSSSLKDVKGKLVLAFQDVNSLQKAHDVLFSMNT